MLFFIYAIIGMQVFLLFTISIQFHILANDFHERAPPSCPQLIGTRENPKEIYTLFSFLVLIFFFIHVQILEKGQIE